MCGICGAYLRDGGRVDEKILEAMVTSLSHRGPDDQVIQIDGPIGLGHSRLSIIDLVTGNQPMCNEDGSLWIVFNGEIFNYLELREILLSRKHVFRSSSDTEVIIHGYEEFGTDFFSMMNGQWAIALWSEKNRELLLCRDRVGICPLYYTIRGQKVVFSSEVKALWQYPGIPKDIDYRGLAETFTFWTTIAPQTIYRGICELPPGHWISFLPSSIRESEYWSLQYPEYEGFHSRTAADCIEGLQDILSDATRLRFTRSDVPVAAYLSGGIDSSVTSAVIRTCTDSDLKTFSLRFRDHEFDEGPYQQQMVDRLGTEHTSIVVSGDDIARVFPEVIRYTERPILRTAPAPMFLLSRLVRSSGYKVVVTGEGSDEILGGYDIFREALVRAFIARDPDSSRRTDIIQLLYPWLQRNPASIPAFARRFFSQNLDPMDPALSHRPRWQTGASLYRLLDRDVREEVLSYKVTEDLIDRMPGMNRKWHTLSRAQWLEIQTLLSGYLLSSQGDRMLMGNSIEGRFPFLDHRLIDFANQLPPRYKIMGLNEKYILKEAFRDMVPPEILNRPKQPYRAPDAGSFFEKPVDWVDEITDPDMIKKLGIFNPTAVQHLIAKCRKHNGRGMSNSDNMAVTAMLSTLLIQRQLKQFS